MIDFTFPPEVEEIRRKVRSFMDDVVRPRWAEVPDGDRRETVRAIVELRRAAREDWGLWLPHMPPEWGGMGLGPTAMAAVSAEAAKVSIGPFVLNAQAPDEGNQHTLLHWGTAEQKEKYLRPLCEGTARSCFAMTEPEVAGSDPTLIKTFAYPDGDEWVINGHKWFISGARGAKFALLIARTEEDPDVPQASNSCFIVDLPADGVRLAQPLRDPHRGPARACGEPARWPWAGPPARPVPTRTRPARTLHALDRSGGDRARHDGAASVGALQPRQRPRREARDPVAHRRFGR
jgi:acyl-CoA dehydrogenase